MYSLSFSSSSSPPPPTIYIVFMQCRDFHMFAILFAYLYSYLYLYIGCGITIISMSSTKEITLNSINRHYKQIYFSILPLKTRLLLLLLLLLLFSSSDLYFNYLFMLFVQCMMYKLYTIILFLNTSFIN